MNVLNQLFAFWYQRQWRMCHCSRYVHASMIMCPCGHNLQSFQMMTLQDMSQYWGLSVCTSCQTLYTAYSEKCGCGNGLAVLRRHPEPEANTIAAEYPMCPRCSDLMRSPMMLFCDLCGKMLRLPVEYTTPRPTITVKLRREAEITCTALLDTGATYNMFPGVFAALLGIDLSACESMLTSGIVPNATITCYKALVELGLLGKFYETVVYFSFDLSPIEQGLLGKIGFFDRFAIEVDDSTKTVVVRENERLRRMKYITCPSCGADRKDVSSDFCFLCGSSLWVQRVREGIPQHQPVVASPSVHKDQ